MVKDATSAGSGRRSWTARIVGAVMLDATVYREVEHDTSATGQAAGVVVMAALAALVGGTSAGGGGPVGGIVGALAGWLTWGAVAYLVGDRLLGGTASWGELLRTLGFAQAPGILFAAAAVPFVGWLVEALVSLWIVAAAVVALREALDVSTGRAVLTGVLGWFCVLLLRLFLPLPAP